MRCTGSATPACEERRRHASSDEEEVHPGYDVLEDLQFVAHLGPADDGGKRPFGVFQDTLEGLHLFFEEEPGHRRQVFRDAHDRGMGPVRCSEGIVDIDLREAGETLREGRIVCLLLRVEPEVSGRTGRWSVEGRSESTEGYNIAAGFLQDSSTDCEDQTARKGTGSSITCTDREKPLSQY